MVSIMKSFASILASAALASLPACEGAPEAPTGPLVGYFHGGSFTVGGGTAERRGGQLNVTLANKEADCVGGVNPVAGTRVVNVAVLAAQLEAGSYELGSEGGLPYVGVTSFYDGTPQQVSVVLSEGGYLHVQQLTEQIFQASMDVASDGVTLKGVFSATVCPP